MRRLARTALASLIGIASALAAPAQDQATKPFSSIQTGFSIIENEAKFVVPAGPVTKDQPAYLFAIDLSGQSWQASVKEHEIELKSTGKPTNQIDKWTLISLGEIKVVPGREYQVSGHKINKGTEKK
ncbi:MAG: hypothetical protein ACKO85_19105, partial [Isosphaeraceae bacterium]